MLLSVQRLGLHGAHAALFHLLVREIVQAHDQYEDRAPDQLLGIRRKAQDRKRAGEYLHQQYGAHDARHLAAAAIRMDAANDAHEHGLQKVGISVTDLGGIDAADDDQAGDAAEDGNDEEHADGEALVVDRGEARRDGVAAKEVKLAAKARLAKEEGQRHGNHQEQYEDQRHAEHLRGAKGREGRRQARDAAAAGERHADARIERHRAERGDQGIGGEFGDHEAVEQAEDDGADQRHTDGQEDRRAFVQPREPGPGEDHGGENARRIGVGDHGQVDAADHEGKHHAQRQETELGNLIRHGTQIARGVHRIAEHEGEDDHHEQQNREQYGQILICGDKPFHAFHLHPPTR